MRTSILGSVAWSAATRHPSWPPLPGIGAPDPEAPIRRLTNVFGTDATERWHVSPRLALALWLIPFAVILLAAVLRLFARPLWRAIIADEGPLEWFQFAMLAAAAGFAALCAIRLFRHSRTLPGLGFLALSGALVFVAGEEIAWGQLVLGFETPQALADANYKAEATLHNVNALVDAFDLGKLVVGFYGLLAAWIASRVLSGPPGRAVDLFIPPPFLWSAFLMVVGYRLGRLTPFRRAFPVASGELEEVCLYFAALAFCWLAWRRVGSEASPKGP